MYHDLWMLQPFCVNYYITVFLVHMLATGLLTPCCRATRKLVIALPCVVDGSRVSSFSYVLSCTRVCQLVSLTYRFKVIDSLLQEVGSQVTHKHTSPDTLFLEPENCNKVTTHSDNTLFSFSCNHGFA